MDADLLPQEVRAQLDAEHRFGPWLCSQYSEQQRAEWWAIWTTTTEQGRQLLQQQRQQSQTRAQAHQQRIAAQAEAQREQERQRSAHQQQWHRNKGDLVRISSPQTTLHDRVGVVQRMAWEGDTYFAYVLVDPLPPNHPLSNRDIRFRPTGCMPIEYRFNAQDLQDNV